MKKEIPILFNTLMVQAIMEGRKTMTRRIVKWSKEGEWQCFNENPNDDDIVLPVENCPYGKPGDILWVRESCMPYQPGRPYIYKAELTPEQLASGAFKFTPSIHMPKAACRIFLEVTEVRVERLQDISPDDAGWEGVESWNEDFVTEPGALLADYANYLWKDDPNHPEYFFPSFGNPVDSFRSLWIKINGADSWNANPWVWVVSFNVLSTTGKPCI